MKTPMSIDEIALYVSQEEPEKSKKWLLEFQVANQMTLRELAIFCTREVDWVRERIFGQ